MAHYSVQSTPRIIVGACNVFGSLLAALATYMLVSRRLQERTYVQQRAAAAQSPPDDAEFVKPGPGGA